MNGKRILITGASRGIGEAAARVLAERGAKVAVLARNGAALEVLAADISGIAITADVSDFASMEKGVAAVVAEWGGLDVLVNNAGLIDPIARIEDSDPTDWGQIVDVNLKGVYYGIRAALPAMDQGTIINISSGAATGALEGWSHYCATKAAVLSLTKCTHLENASRGIVCVGLSPGTVATDMQRDIAKSGINAVSQMPWDAHIPAEWVGKAIAYLCGPDGAKYAGTDFSIKTPEGRAAVGLPAPS